MMTIVTGRRRVGTALRRGGAPLTATSRGGIGVSHQQYLLLYFLDHHHCCRRNGGNGHAGKCYIFLIIIIVVVVMVVMVRLANAKIEERLSRLWARKQVKTKITTILTLIINHYYPHCNQ